ncbi:hypothetical protein SAMN04488021_1444 [Paracoccus aminovorans]|uniref:Uncharacterized protein n=1 Tax=Paracoccus aminovorans TaxID=34004 RepID=A0A1I3E1D4_9RHOB|nr:hypothetical protein [Paracoccus aminovorans]CQR84679.1 hypothetical protein JCM7685_0086 [Paracoccus aminovorans]SFH92501.1 hypothetical protein SAMN04488021_1444 [Paracoccus aminovorans]
MNRSNQRIIATTIAAIAISITSVSAQETSMRDIFDAGPPEVRRLIPNLPSELGNGASLLMKANAHVQDALAIWLAQEPDFDQFQANLSEAKNLYSGGAEQISKVSVPDGIKLSDTALDALIAKGYQNIETSDQVLDELVELGNEASELIKKMEGGAGSKSDVGRLIEIVCQLDMFVGILSGAVAAVA